MSPSGGQHTKESIIADVFAFYSQDFTAYFAAAIAITESLPEQVNNEIRNAFTHLARASAAPDLKTAQDEAKKAKAHIERANRDCLKCSIIYHRNRIDEQLNTVALKYKSVPAAILARWNHVIDERERLLTEEHLGTNPNLTADYQALLLECEALKTDLRTSYGSLSRITYGWVKKAFAYVVGGLFIGILSTAVWEMFVRDKVIIPSTAPYTSGESGI